MVFLGSSPPASNTNCFELQPAPSTSAGPVPPPSPRVAPKPAVKISSNQKPSGDIDDTRPGGVRTLKGRYEKAVSQQLSPPLHRRAPIPVNDDSTNNESKVKFNEEVRHIPRPDRASTLSPAPSPSPPPPPPPPPPSPPPPNQDRQPPTGADDIDSTKAQFRHPHHHLQCQSCRNENRTNRLLFEVKMEDLG